MAYRFEKTLSVGKIMWKGEQVAASDPMLCEGCGECLERCLFGALSMDKKNEKCMVNPQECYGCGICRNVCPTGALEMAVRPLGVPF